jgi:hypothetical protein
MRLKQGCGYYHISIAVNGNSNPLNDFIAQACKLIPRIAAQRMVIQSEKQTPTVVSQRAILNIVCAIYLNCVFDVFFGSVFVVSLSVYAQ